MGKTKNLENRKKVINPNFSEGRKIRVQNTDPKTQTKQVLIEDELKKNIEMLLQYTENQKDTDLENDCVLQLVRLNGLEKRQHEGTISEADYKLEKARIRKATQDLIGKMG